ncbi:hypothetical protein FK521_29290, partial [Klebsiella pneumoniae]|nr:hypothetical protein [Klebsiella pneumoniae]
MRNIVETKEFVWNLATRPLAMAMNETSASIPHHEDEFVRAGLTAAAARFHILRIDQLDVDGNAI